MVDPQAIQSLIAADVEALAAGASDGAAVLRSLSARVATAQQAITDALGTSESQLGAMEIEASEFQVTAAKCATIIAAAHAKGREDLATLAQGRMDAATGAAAELDATRTGIEAAQASGSEWTAALTALGGRISERLGAFAPAASAARAPAPAGPNTEVAEVDAFAALDAGGDSGGADVDDWEAKLAALMKETGAKPTSEIASIPDDDGDMGIPSLVVVADDDYGGEDPDAGIKPAKGKKGKKAGVPAKRKSAGVPATAKAAGVPAKSGGAKVPAKTAKASKGGGKPGLWIGIVLAVIAIAAGVFFSGILG